MERSPKYCSMKMQCVCVTETYVLYAYISTKTLEEEMKKKRGRHVNILFILKKWFIIFNNLKQVLSEYKVYLFIHVPQMQVAEATLYVPSSIKTARSYNSN